MRDPEILQKFKWLQNFTEAVNALISDLQTAMTSK